MSRSIASIRSLPGRVPGGVPVPWAPLLPVVSRAAAGGVEPVAGRAPARPGGAPPGAFPVL